ncbi:MAG TPA: trypsin-like peptidase domain-containing protein [Nitrososphaerales archaeon]|nr:trypsin-like peptidase domain-containing protein [Nitrososphaerales archaeon]
METSVAQKSKRSVSLLVIIVIGLSVLLGVVGTLYYFETIQTGNQISSLDRTIGTLQSEQKSMIQLENANGTYPGANFFSNSSGSMNAVTIYNYANQSVVTVEGQQTTTDSFGQPSTSEVLGSGFVVIYNNSDYIVTNYHVVKGDTNISVTFSNGDAYSATVIGSDPYSDLAVLSTSAPKFEYHPLSIISSSALLVGQPVLAIGNPYGLSGSETIGIISQLGRTIQEAAAGNYAIANVIQISTPINPGNSGGPLFNSYGQVVGITTAIVSGSQGVGFAIPSDTILEELPYLITTGSYNFHPYLGISTADMSYDLAKALGVNVTYGVLVESVLTGGPAAQAGVIAGNGSVIVGGEQYTSGGDIIVSINGTRIINGDALSSWLQEHALPNQNVELGIIRSGSPMTIQVTLGTRPAP